MDVNSSYPLVVFPTQQRTLVPVVTEIVSASDGQEDSQADPFVLWRAFWRLALLLWLVLRCWKRQIVELRWQANYWQAQHQRARQREAELAEQNRLLQGEIRELKRRLFGRKSETASSTKPTKP